MAKCLYEIKNIRYEDLKKEVKLPKFQRNIVWSSSLRKELIDTIKNGYPFGSLLLYEINDGPFQFQLIDGLQRLSTIIDYEKNPYNYIDFSDEEIAGKELEEISKTYFDTNEAFLPETCKNKMISIMQTVFQDSSIVPANKALSVEKRVKKEIPLDDEMLNVVAEKSGEILENINRSIDLKQLELPVVIFKGDASDLPNVFERVNAHGTKLSKYEMCAALWNDKTYRVPDESILEKVENRYQSIMDASNITVDNFEKGSILQSKEINLFEYAYAIGKLVKEKCVNVFFKDNADDSATDSVGFALLTVSVGGNVKQTEKLNEFFKNATSKNMVELKNKIVEVSSQVDHILKPYIISKDGKYYTKYMEAQIVSIIGTLFKLKYNVNSSDLKISENSDSGKKYELFKQYMPQHYLYDLMKEYWAGSGDVKTMLILNNMENNKYFNPIDENNWRTILDDWMTGQDGCGSQAKL